jgi:Spy/CpxP family protein refolding chaperone
MAALTPVEQRRRGWLLPVSLAVNLLLGGFVLAWVVAMPPSHPSMVMWQRKILPDLSPADAAIVTDATTRIADAQEQGAKSMHANFSRVSALLAAEPLDQDALERTLAEMSTIRTGQQVAMDNAFFKELVALSPDGRAKILSALQREGRRWRPPPGGH